MGIKELRDKLSITQEELAYNLGVSVFTVSRWERGSHFPRRKQKRAFIDFCIKSGLNPDDLIGQEESHVNTKVAIRQMRNDALLTQEEFARALDVSLASIWNWEQGHEPSNKMKKRLKEFCEKNGLSFDKYSARSENNDY